MECRRGRRRDNGRGRRQAKLLVVGGALVSFGVLAAAPGASAAEVGDPRPVVTIRAINNGSVFVDGVRPCSLVSSASFQPGELEVRRSGPTDSALPVLYTAQPSIGGEGDFEPLSGEITIPAGASAASIQVTLRSANYPPPYHEHRTSTLTSSLRDEAGYDVGDLATASITLRFDIAVFECNQTPATPAGAPTGATTTTSTTPGATAVRAATATPAAALPFTGAPITLALAGAGSGLVTLGAIGARYGRPRWKRMRARRTPLAPRS